jgi:hypothetical protein
VRHIEARHGAAAVQGDRKQRAVTSEDLGRLAWLVQHATPAAAEQQRIKYTVARDGETHVAVFEVQGQRRKTLALKTYYIKKK